MSSGKKTEVGYLDQDYKSNQIQGYNEGPERKVDSVTIIKDERGLKGLDYAIDEMIEFNKIVLNQVLLPMKTYENRNVNGNH